MKENPENGISAHFGAIIELGDKRTEPGGGTAEADSFKLELFVRVTTGVPIRFGLRTADYVTLGDLLRYIGKQFGLTGELSFDSFWGGILDLKVRPELTAGPSATGSSADVKGTIALKKPWELPPKSWWPDPFISVKGISVFYQQGGLDFSLDADFFGRELTLDYPLPTPAPKVPLFDLKYFALGQRVGFDTTATDVRSIIDDMQNQIKQKDGDGITDHFIRLYKPERHWLFAASLTLRDLIDLDVIFNDPVMYGLAIGFGEKLSVLKGFSFEILYKKISEDVGLFYLDLSLPEAIRQMDFGQASITLPCVAISIYTNGDFKIAVGWPLGDRSVVVQLIVMISAVPVPFLGGGGCYFGKLSSATLPDVPAGLNPIIAFGLALEIGLGKSFNKGILSAKLSITLHGILEGRLGWNQPQNNDEEFRLMVPDYFMFQGTLGITGIVEGEVNFKIAKAGVSVRIGSDVTVRFETAKDVIITVSAYVDVALKVEVGGFKIFGKRIALTVNLSFKAHISESFTIKITDSKGLKKHFLPPPPIQWNPELAPSTESGTKLAEIPLIFSPQITLALKDGRKKAHFIAGLMVSTIPKQGETVSPFEKIVKMVVIWMVYAWKGKPIPKEHPEEITLSGFDVEQIIEQLNTPKMIRSMSSHEFPSYVNLKTFFKRCVTFSIAAQSPEEDGAAQTKALTAAVFPIFPDLRLTATGMADSIDFNTFNRRPQKYTADLEKYFDTMQSLFTTDDEQLNPKEGPSPSRSLATYIFEDYFAMLLKAAAGEMLEQYGFLPGDEKKLAELLSPRQSEKQSGMNFDLLASTVSRFSYHGLRIPDEFGEQKRWPEQNTYPLYSVTGQQFVMDLPDDVSAERPYTIALKRSDTDDWLTFGQPEPIFEIADKEHVALLQKLEKIALSSGNPAVERMEPLIAAPSRFVLQNRTNWEVNESDSGLKTVLHISNHLHEAVAAHSSPLPVVVQRRRVGQGAQHTDVSFQPALTIDLTLRPVDTGSDVTFNEKSTVLSNIYQVGGTDENNGTRLNALLADKKALDGVTISILYPPDAAGGNGTLVSRTLDADAVLLIKTNLSTESNPREVLHVKSFRKNNQKPEEAAYAFLSNHQEFLRLIRECSIVNSGGFFLYYCTESTNSDATNAGIQNNHDLPEYLFRNSVTVPVQLLISFKENTPLYPYHNALVIDDSTASPSTSESIYMAIVEKLPDWQAAFPAGCLAYQVTRDDPTCNLPDKPTSGELEKCQLDSLYNLMRCRVDEGGGFTKSIWGLPVGPIKNTQSGDMHNKGESPAPPGKWVYRQIIPAYRYFGTTPNNKNNSRYAGIGETIRLNFDILDLFGNRFPDETVSDLTATLSYFDRLLPVNEWPGINAVYDVEKKDNVPTLTITLRFDCSVFNNMSGNSGSGKKPADKAKETYAIIREQITDKNTTIIVTTSLAPQMAKPIPENDLKDFLRTIDECLSSRQLTDDANPIILTMSFPITLPEPDDYLFPIDVKIRISRNESYCDSRHPAIAGVNSDIAPNIRHESDDHPDSLRLFTTRFEAAFNGDIKLAEGPARKKGFHSTSGIDSDRISLFGIRFGRKHTGVGVTFSPDISPVYYALPPLSTKLITETFDNIIVFGDGGVDDITLATRKFTDVDLDVWMVAFLTAFDDFIGPKTGIATCRVNPAAYDNLMCCKKKIASALANRIAPVFNENNDDSHEKDEAQREASETFYQRLLIDLKAAYTIGTVVQVFADVTLPNITEDTKPRKLYGQIRIATNDNTDKGPSRTEKPAADTSRECNFSTGKLLLADGRQRLTGLFSVTQPTAYKPKPGNLIYDVSFLEYDIRNPDGIGNGSSEDRYLSSSWLKFVLPGENTNHDSTLNYTIANDAEIPVPLREYPEAPVLLEQNARQMVNVPETLNDAVRWTYDVGFLQPSIPHDSIEVTVIYNKRAPLSIIPKIKVPVKETRLRPLPRSLFEALARFTSEYPVLDGFFNKLENAKMGDKTAEAVVDRFMELVEGVAFTLDPKNNVTSKAPIQGLSGLKEIRNRYTFDQQKYDRITVTRRDRNDTWPHIAGFEVSKTEQDKRLYIRNTSGSASKENVSSDRHWQHMVSFPDRDVRIMENALCVLELQRNATLVQGHETADIFIYRTPNVSFRSPVTPLIEMNEPYHLELPKKSTLSKCLSDFLKQLFDKDGARPGLPAKRRFNCSVSAHLSWPLIRRDQTARKDAEMIRVTLPVAVSTDVVIESDTFEKSVKYLVDQYRAWYEDNKLFKENIKKSELLFDMKVFASLSESIVPILHLPNVVCAIERDARWWK